MSHGPSNDIRKNASGCNDPTAYAVIQKSEDEKRFRDLLFTIFYITKLAGFDVMGRIELMDKKTGKIWK